MDIEFVNLVIAVAVLVVTIEFNLQSLNKHIQNWESSFYQSLSALAKNNEITKKEEKKIADEITKQWKNVNELRKRAKNAIFIRQLLPILLTIEVGHITLQFFQWSWLYEWILPGLNKAFLIAIIAITLVFFIIRATLGDKKILEYELHNLEVIEKYKFGFQ